MGVDGFPVETVDALRARGHAVIPRIRGFNRSLFGRGQIIRSARDGTLVGGSDPRADGCASAT